MHDKIQDFKDYLDKKIALIRALTLFDFDQSTGAPEGGAESRAKFIGILAAEEFKMRISPQMKEFLDALSAQEDSLDEITLAMYRECKKDYERDVNIPADQFQAYAELVSKSGVVWENAKGKSDFPMFAPYLKEVIEYQRRFIQFRGYTDHPYNTLLGDYEPGMTVEKLDAFFEELKATIVPLLHQIKESNKTIRRDFLDKPVGKNIQQQISEMLMDAFDYDRNRGILRESEHPFTTNFGQNDVRITTHYHEEHFLSSIFSVIHETGHALYELNKLPEIADTILDEGVSMGIHESQSRFYENVLGRSLSFWQAHFAKLQDCIGDTLTDVNVLEFYEAVNIVEPSLIRIEADELTYPLHIMVRYEIEKEIFSENPTIDIDNLPALWNEKMLAYLGVTPADDTHGVLQDVHWSQGYFGYFPSYALGSAYAAQFFSYMQQDLPVDVLLCLGNTQEISAWLVRHIQQYGKLRTPSRLIKDIRGEDLDAKYYTEYLEEKFKVIYEL